MRDHGHGVGVAAGQVRRQTRLGSEAVYVVRDVSGPLVELEVIRAPGLRPGQTFRFTQEAVLAMELIESGANPGVTRDDGAHDSV